MKRNFFMLTIVLILTGLLGYPSMGLAQEEWKRKADMPTPRCALNAAVVSNMIYVMGGANNYGFHLSQGAMATLEIYNPQTDKWSKGPDMPTPRYSFTAGVVNGKIYVVGGASERDRRGKLITVSVKTVEVFDPATNAWQKYADVDGKFTRVSSGGRRTRWKDCNYSGIRKIG